MVDTLPDEEGQFSGPRPIVFGNISPDFLVLLMLIYHSGIGFANLFFEDGWSGRPSC